MTTLVQMVIEGQITAINIRIHRIGLDAREAKNYEKEYKIDGFNSDDFDNQSN